MNKFLFGLIFCSLFAFSCKNDTKNISLDGIDNIENKYIKITFNQKVNGYNVSALWTPIKTKYDNAIGPAIIEFKNETTKFSISNTFFALPTQILDIFVVDNEILDIKKRNISLDYNEYYYDKDDTTLFYIETFAFIDLNFDGEKELVLSKFNQGQRGVNSYDVYSVSNYDNTIDYKLLSYEPYNQFDEMTILDKINKQLIFHASGGASSSSDYYYTFSHYGYTLTKSVESEDDGFYTYSFKDGCKTLISKRPHE